MSSFPPGCTVLATRAIPQMGIEYMSIYTVDRVWPAVDGLTLVERPNTGMVVIPVWSGAFVRTGQPA